jgi:hypothetical protein
VGKEREGKLNLGLVRGIVREMWFEAGEHGVDGHMNNVA